jgi:kinetochore protein Mis12/MTW1
LQGIYRLETLLETAIDKHFDLFEIFVLRNTFAIETDLIPFIALAHQVRTRLPSRLSLR